MNYYTCWGCAKIVEEFDRIDTYLVCLSCSLAFRDGTRSIKAEEVEKNYQAFAHMHVGMRLPTMNPMEAASKTILP